MNAQITIATRIDVLRDDLRRTGWRDHYDFYGRIPKDAPLIARKIVKRINRLKVELATRADIPSAIRE